MLEDLIEEHSGVGASASTGACPGEGSCGVRIAAAG
jgi:hypothetical protein